jgi:hypothetical protein
MASAHAIRHRDTATPRHRDTATRRGKSWLMRGLGPTGSISEIGSSSLGNRTTQNQESGIINRESGSVVTPMTKDICERYRDLRSRIEVTNTICAHRKNIPTTP